MEKSLNNSKISSITSKKHNNDKEWLLFYILLNERGFQSELSGKSLIGNIRKEWFYFLLSKSKHPELRYCPSNIIIISDEERAQILDNPTIPERIVTIQRDYVELVEQTKSYEREYLDPILKHSTQNKHGNR